MAKQLERKAPTVREYSVFCKWLLAGVVLSETFRLFLNAGKNITLVTSSISPLIVLLVVFGIATLTITYSLTNAWKSLRLFFQRPRLELILSLALGCVIDTRMLRWDALPSIATKFVDGVTGIAALLFLLVLLFYPAWTGLFKRKSIDLTQFAFVDDQEIDDKSMDVLGISSRAESFASTVMASSAHPGLVFGVDGPWGGGKSSFVNLACKYLEEKASDRIIVCKFEPLPYANDPDIAQKLLEQLSIAIRKQAFAPEITPIANRYMRMLRAKTDISFAGLKLTLDPSDESIEDMLNDLDSALERVDKRVVIVIDDLDRLEAVAINAILFAIRKTLRLQRAAYILCYDTDNIVGSADDKSKAREFLEKFVTVKQNVFMDLASLVAFLRSNWAMNTPEHSSVPSERLYKLGELLEEVATLLEGADGASYTALLGDMRKIKRFINSLLLVRFEEIDLGMTDFDKKDLINLMLIQLIYPKIFRRIYFEETGGRSGMFSVQRDVAEKAFVNSPEFSEFVDAQDDANSAFLLNSLFTLKSVGSYSVMNVADEEWRSKACFNSHPNWNLQKYLKQIVLLESPLPQETYALYINAIEEIRNGASVRSVLNGSHFSGETMGSSHLEFWGTLLARANRLTLSQGEDAINTLVDFLPRYSSLGEYDHATRTRAIYSLLLLLDTDRWADTRGRFNDLELRSRQARRILGSASGDCLIDQLVNGRGVIGWRDLLLFRVSCCANRGNLFNVRSSLVSDASSDADVHGASDQVTINEMRRFSQQVFARFKRDFITKKVNFYDEVNASSDKDFSGGEQAHRMPNDADRNSIKNFAMYQLANAILANGAGIGCGYYDESGADDRAQIAAQMNEYIFGFCFNPEEGHDNMFKFVDHCLAHFFSKFNFDLSLESEPRIASMFEGYSLERLKKYWVDHALKFHDWKYPEDRMLRTYDRQLAYKSHVPKLFSALDEFSKESV
jgi:hypothetical protein